MKVDSISNPIISKLKPNVQPSKQGATTNLISDLKNKHSNVSINMSNAYIFADNSSTTLNISPAYTKKAANDPAVQANIERLAGLADSFPTYLSTHNTLPDGSQVSKVSFVVDENGGVSCNCEYRRKNTSDNSPTFFDRLQEKREEEREASRIGGRIDVYSNSNSTKSAIDLKQAYATNLKHNSTRN